MKSWVYRNDPMHWPPDRWHPAYDSIKDWLNNEAPVASPLVVDALGKARNQRMRVRFSWRRV